MDTPPNNSLDLVPPDVEAERVYVALLTSHQGAIHAFINSLLPGDPGVEDVLQRANLVLWSKRQGFQIGTNFKAWAFSIARWETKAWLTEQRRQNWLVFDDSVIDSLFNEFVAISGEEEREIVRSLRHCLAKLSEKQRNLVLNYYQQGQSMRECAAKTKRSEGSLRVTLFRIRGVLRRCIQTHTLAKEG